MENSCSLSLHIVALFMSKPIHRQKDGCYKHYVIEKNWRAKFSSKMFVYSQDDTSFYKCLAESSGPSSEVFMITIQGPEYFVLNSESDFANIYVSGSMGFVTVPNFP